MKKITFEYVAEIQVRRGHLELHKLSEVMFGWTVDGVGVQLLWVQVDDIVAEFGGKPVARDAKRFVLRHACVSEHYRGDTLVKLEGKEVCRRTYFGTAASLGHRRWDPAPGCSRNTGSSPPPSNPRTLLQRRGCVVRCWGCRKGGSDREPA